MTHFIREYFERFGFEVCSRIGEIIRIPAAKVRLYFIYASFLTFGSPLLIYLILAFFKGLRQNLRLGRSRFYDL